MTSEAVLRAFAELSKSAPQVRRDVIGDSRLFLLQQYDALKIFQSGSGPIAALPPVAGPGGLRRKATETSHLESRVLAAAALHKHEQLLRVGWIWFSGTVKEGDDSVTYCFPALSVPVERRMLIGSSLRTVGDAEITELIESADVRSRLLRTSQFGGGALYDHISGETLEYHGVDQRLLPRLTKLMAWCNNVARAAGLDVVESMTVDQESPLARRWEPGIALHVGCALYLDRPAPVGTRRESLLKLAALPKLDESAFAKIYGESPVATTQPRPVLAVRPLSRRQLQIAEEVGARELSVISGAPGTGKTHMLTVLALDAISQGQSVLVAASSPHAVDVLVDHFARTPGPTPVAFGGSRHGTRLARELSELISTHTGVEARRDVALRDEELLASAATMLEAEEEARRLERDPLHRIRVSEELDRAGDLEELERIVGEMEGRSPAAWWSRLRNKSVVRSRLRGDGNLRAQIERVRRLSDAQRLLASGGLQLGALLDDAVQFEAAAADDRGRRVTGAWLERVSRRDDDVLAKISSAIGASRDSRRHMLERIDPARLVTAAPLWVGSVRDVDDVLPTVAAMFDLVILDEASQIDQINAANALVRARRAVICGDPQQLGHVSFTSDEAIDAAARLNGLDSGTLNTRAHSAFDVASMRVPASVLDEHFRSAPHLIEFSSRRFYGGQVHTATRHPNNESADHIDISIVDGHRDSKKVNEAEVAACLAVADELVEQGWDSIGFVSPFRAQADALEEAVLDRYRLEEIDHFGFRVGTVHGFQGDERRVIIASWAVGADEGDGPWRFVNQKNLFNVMVTRARERLVVVTSNPNPPGLAGEYVRWSQPLENLVRDVDDPDGWTDRVARAVQDTGVTTRVGYRVGRHVVDLVIGSGEDAVAVDCSPHPDGPEAHLDRALLLRRTGWRTADAFQSRWGDRVGQLAIELGSKYSHAERDNT